jgi:hypothetical protein
VFSRVDFLFHSCLQRLSRRASLQFPTV